MRISKIRTFIFIFILSLSAVSLEAVSSTNQTLTTVFTAPETCFIGFGRRKVKDNVRLRPDDHFVSATVVDNKVNSGAVEFTFYAKDPIVSATPAQAGVYYSDQFYAYCQVATTKKVKVTLTVPLTMKAKLSNGADNASGTDLAYEIVDLDSMYEGLLPGTFKKWGDIGSSNSQRTLIIDETTKKPDIRVVMCQPILLKVDGATLNKAFPSGTDTKYFSLNFKLTVETK